MPLEQTDMNVGFNSGADKVTFRRYESYDMTRAMQGSTDNNSTFPGRLQDQKIKKVVLVIPGNSLDRLSRNQ